MEQVAVRIIRDEHLAIGAVVYSLRQLTRRSAAGDAPADLRLLHAILDYIVEYPDRWHHPKEDRYLFAALRARCGEADRLVGELEAEHLRSGALIEELKGELIAYGNGAPVARFAGAVEAYADFEWEHMRKEEDVLLPLAQKWLTPEDWRSIAQAFRENDNPLFGISPKDEAEQLYLRILALSPRG